MRGLDEIDRDIAEACARLQALRRERHDRVEAARRAPLIARDRAILGDFDRGELNVQRLAERHGVSVGLVRTVLWRNDRSVILAKHARRQQRLRALAEHHAEAAA